MSPSRSRRSRRDSRRSPGFDDSLAAMTQVEAVVVGSGPNGLAAAIVLARAGVAVRVLEAADVVGGGMRTEELTLPGYAHDVCSAIHPLGRASPFFKTVPLAELGVAWIESPSALA